MTPKIRVGNVVTLDDLGPVKILQVYDHGAAVVKDNDGRKWLIPNDVISECEQSLLFAYDERKV